MSDRESTAYFLRRGHGSSEHGPFSLIQMRDMVSSGEVSRFHEVSADNGSTWGRAATYPELWETRDLAPLPQREPPIIEVPQHRSGSGSTPAYGIPYDQGAVSLQQIAPPNTLDRSVPEDRTTPPSNFGLALSGFVTATTALCLGCIPLLLWVFQYGRGYWLVPLAFPFFAASVTGLVLSTVAFSRRKTGFATTGLVVGICASVLTLTTAAGWLVTDDPTTGWIRRLTSTAEADVALARKNFMSSLNRYRDPPPADDTAAALRRVTTDLMTLTTAHHRLLVAASTTPRFRQHFTALDDLRINFEQFSEALRLRDNITPSEAITRVGQNTDTLKQLLDLLNLYQTQQISIDMAQAKFRDT